MAATSTFPYVIVNAFTDSAFGGNPAAIVLLPPGSLIADRMLLNASKMTSIARSFAQPTTVFLSSSIHTELPDSDETRVYDILFVLDKYFTPLCGHGTLAATKAICRGMFPGVSQGVANPVVKFRTPDDTIVCARAMDPGNRDSTADGEFYELTIPVATMQQVTEAERCDIRNMLGKVLGKDADNVGLKYVAHEVSDTTSYDRLVMVLDQSEKLEGRNVDINAFLTGRYEAYTLTHATPGQKTAFVSRSFMPVTGVMEDHVCGTAHALMMPYYAAQADVDIVPGKEAFVRQVGPRGGDLWVTLDEENEVIRLRGNAKLFSRGEITF
ncbi:hypothetical protein SCLCIDRAFT_1218325 [Scleroderma citrinum Foug A]|uniref:Diaminopimelate epimerase-like protein n=1 Tax=Scleroderma citrinum Foug A TaxID=1036808 RepID=A0A0C3DS08_9AGAM|nr:hypothetical protein SCLCIDRAFT_1218325 [Scleroderma citrinum Foug A]